MKKDWGKLIEDLGKRIDCLSDKIWKLENPSRFNKGDRVKYWQRELYFCDDEIDKDEITSEGIVIEVIFTSSKLSNNYWLYRIWDSSLKEVVEYEDIEDSDIYEQSIDKIGS